MAETVARETGRPLGRRARPEGRRLWVYFVAPLFAAFGLFYLWPALNTLLGSFFEWSVFNPWNLVEPATWTFAGFENYIAVLTSERFWNAAINTVVWLILFPAATTTFSLLVAVLIWQVAAGGRLFRSVFVLPMTMSLTAIGVIWKLMFNPDYGTVDGLVGFLNADISFDWGFFRFQASNWLSNPGALDLGFAELSLVNLSLIVAAFWAFTGFGVITFTAGLTAVPTELVEAGRVDGANGRQVVWHIVVPMLRRSIVVVAVVSVIFALRTFDIVWVMTAGGPANDTEVLAVLLWKQAFAFLDAPLAGQASAIAILLSVVMVTGAFPYLRGVLRGGGR
ncbi:MAG: carbohydrate ABC transporter permease [Actinomycetota bacterium]